MTCYASCRRSCGHNLEAYQSVLFCEFGYRSFDQLDAEDDEA